MIELATVRNNPTKSGKYQALYLDHTGKRRTITMSTKNKALKTAQRKEAVAEEIKLGLRRAPDAADKHLKRPIEEVAQEYLDWGDAQGGRKGKPWGQVHARNRESHLAWWQSRLRLIELGDLVDALPQVEKAVQYLLNKGRTGKTVANYSEALRAFCIWCKGRRYLANDPLEGLAKFDTTPQTRRRAMTKDEVKKLFATCAVHRRLLYETAMYSGLRANELRSLTVEDLDAENCRLLLRSDWTKNRTDGFQPLPQALIFRLQEFANSGDVHQLYERLNRRKNARRSYPANPLLCVPAHTARAIDADLKAAGIEKWTREGKIDFHAIRVAYINFVFESNASAKETQTLARRSTLHLTMNVYGRTRDERLAAVIESIAEKLEDGPESVPAVYRQAVGAEQESAAPFSIQRVALF